MKYKKADLKPDERACLDLRGLYEQYGYRKYKMGKFEEYSLYVENKDFLASDKVITFTDLDGRLLALKPDVTLSIIQNTKATKESNEKLYYIENVYRESRESHTFQEINQMGLEFIGDVDDYAITEVIALAAKTLRDISKDYILSVSHMDFVVALFETLDLPESTKLKILRSIRNKNVDGIKKIAAATDLTADQIATLCKLPKLFGEAGKVMREARKISISKEMDEALDQLEVIYDALKALGATRRIELDFSMVNDLDYYNGIIFRGYIEGLGKSVLSGGQYDQAMALLGKKVEAIGYALYLNEINRVSNHKREFDVDAVVLYQEGEPVSTITKAVHDLQKEGLSVRAEKDLPKDVRFETLYSLKNGQLRKEDPTC